MEVYQKHPGTTEIYSTTPHRRGEPLRSRSPATNTPTKVNPPSSSTNDSKAWLRRKSQRLDSPARIVDFERKSAADTQREEEAEQSTAADTVAGKQTHSPASVTKAATRTKSTSPWMHKISPFRKDEENQT